MTRPVLFSRPRPGRAGANAAPRPPVRSAGNQARLRALARAAVTRGFDELAGSGDEQITASPGPEASPEPAGGAQPEVGGPAQDAGAAGCTVASGPSYTPSGALALTSSGGRKGASFRMAARFTSGAASAPRCCEVRQFIKWNQRYAITNGAPPHSGFPLGSAADTWIEDRDSAGTRYGRRSGQYSSPAPNCQDEYRLGGVRNQADGDSYCGKDAPSVGASTVGQWQFQLKAIDACSNVEKAQGPVITLDWG